MILFLFCTLKIIFSVKAHYNFLTYPYQLEYREGAGLVTAQDFLQNKNPFSIRQQPQHTYPYGFLYPLIVSKFAKIFGNTLLVHRSITYFFLIATCVIVFFVLLRKKISFIFAFAAMIILHQSLVNAANTSIARPEGLGIFFMTLGIIIPWRWNYSWASLSASIILGILCLLTKQYYIIVIPVIAAYLFIFISKKKSIIYLIISVIAVILVVTILNFVFPLYLNNTLFMHINIATYSYFYMKDQLAVYSEINVYLILIIILSCLISLREFLNKRLNKTVEEVKSDTKKLFLFNSKFKIFSNEPLIRSNIDFLFLFTLLFTLFIFIINIGGHRGNYEAAYLFQLASPYLVLVTFQTLDFAENKLFKSFACLLLIITLNTEFNIQKYDFARFTSCFQQIEDEIKKSKNPLNSPENVSIMINEKKPVYNSGVSEFFLTGRNPLPGASNYGFERTMEFSKEINEKIKNKEFDMILLTETYYSFFIDTKLLYQNYNIKTKVCAPMILQEWTTEIWEPK